MSKILIIGDIHMRQDIPFSASIEDGRSGEWEKVKKFLHLKAEDCDAVVLLGDVLNSKHNHSSVNAELVTFLHGFGKKEIHIIAGNHERYGKNTALDYIKKMYIPNWNVYVEPCSAYIAGQECLMVPFMTPGSMGVATREEAVEKIFSRGYFPAKVNLIFAHHAIDESSVAKYLTEIVLPKKELEKRADHTFFGHIHKPEEISDKIHGTGSVFTQEVGEEEKFVWTIEDGVIEGEKVPCRGIYKVEFNKVDKGEDLSTYPLLDIPKDSIVRATILSKDADVDTIKKWGSRFDGFSLVMDIKGERRKLQFDEKAVFDTSVESLLEIYAKEKKISLPLLQEGYNLIKK